MIESVLERLRKISALAESGIAGERDNARRMLEELCRKYNLSPEEITAPERSWHEINVKSEREARLLNQVVMMVCGTGKVRNSHSGRFNQHRFFELTAAEAIDVDTAFTHYLARWKETESDAFSAFLAVNRILGPPEDGDKEPDELDPVKRHRLMQMMAGMEKTTWRRALEAGSPP